MDEPILILPEHAACSGKGRPDDAFGLSTRLGRLVRALRSRETQAPLSVALTGDWGTGKSSAMHWLRGQLTEIHDDRTFGFKTCLFKPWKYQSREDVLRGLLAVVIAAIRPEGGVLANTGAAAIAVIDGILRVVKGVRGPYGEVRTDGSLLDAAKGAQVAYESMVEPERLYSNEFEIALSDALDKYLGDNMRLAIFVDDLDRCLPEVAIQVLEAMKLFFDQTGVIFILGVDRDVVDRMMVRHYTEALKPEGLEERAHVARKARQYLDKMFRVEVHVPPTDAQVGEFVIKQVEKLDGWNALTEDHQERLVIALKAVAGINPRGVIRSLNSAFIGAGPILELLTEARGDARDSLQTQLAQSVQLRLVEAVLGGSEVAVLASEGHEGEPEGLRVEDWHGLARHARGRAFLHAWSRALQAEGSSYLLRGQIARALNPPAPAPADSEEETEGKRGELVRSQRDDQEARLRPLLEVAEKFKDLAPLLAVRALGSVLRVVEFPADAAMPTEKEDADAALRRLVAAIARHRQVDVETLNIKEIRGLTELQLVGSDITDEELVGITALKELTYLDLSLTRVTDVLALAGLTALRRLHLDFTRVVDISALAGLTELRGLDLAGTDVTDLSPLAGLRRLTYVSLPEGRHWKPQQGPPPPPYDQNYPPRRGQSGG